MRSQTKETWGINSQNASCWALTTFFAEGGNSCQMFCDPASLPPYGGKSCLLDNYTGDRPLGMPLRLLPERFK